MPEVRLESEKWPRKGVRTEANNERNARVAEVRAEISSRAVQPDPDHSLISISLEVVLPRALIRFDATGNTTGEFDAVRVREALSNLVSNAHQYQNQGTEISVRVEGVADDVVLTVSNESPDIEPNVLAKLFEPFQRGGAAIMWGTSGTWAWACLSLEKLLVATATKRGSPRRMDA